MTATHDALHTAELLEHILINVDDVCALLLSQCVSRFWHELIVGSTKLQKELFFTPATTQDLATLGIASDNDAVFARPQITQMVSPAMLSGPPDSSSDFAVLNPFLTWLDYDDREQFDGQTTWAERPPNGTDGCIPSWRKMIPMQPPQFEIRPARAGKSDKVYPAHCLLGEAFDAAETIVPKRNRHIPAADIEPDASCIASAIFWKVVEEEKAAKDRAKGSGGAEVAEPRGAEEVSAGVDEETTE